MRAAAALAAAFALLLLAHAPLLHLPFFWDELGQFVPASLDLYRQGRWIPSSATPNVHPPGVMAYLAGVWMTAGYSIAATRAAMLLLAAAGLLLVWMLARALDASRQASAGAVALLAISPLFFAQSMLAQLDMPAMVFTLLVLLLFLRERLAAAALAAVALVLVKETGVLVPLVLGAWLIRERRYSQAALFAAPLVALAAWLTLLAQATGHPFGDAAFTEYNLFYPLHPVRVAVAFARRIWFLFIANFHWIGTLALVLAWRRSKLLRTRGWRVAGATVAAHVVLLSVTGGAVLERYLLPALAPVLIAFAVALGSFGRVALLAAGTATGLFWNPPYTFPLENNLAFVDMVRLHQKAAELLEQRYPGRRIATAWPLTGALAQPDFGYVRHAFETQETSDFRRSSLQAIDWRRVDILVLYARAWEPKWSLLRISPQIRAFFQRYYGYEPQAAPEAVAARFGLRQIARWERGGQWLVIFQPALRSEKGNTDEHG